MTTAGLAISRGWAATPLWLRLVASVLALFALALSAAGVATVTALHRYLLTQLDGKLARHSEVALRRLHPRLPSGPAPDRDQGDPSRPRIPSAFYTAYTDQAGTLVQTLDSPLESGQPGPAVPPWTPEQTAHLNGRPVTVAATDGDGQWRLLAVPLPDHSGSLRGATRQAETEATVSPATFLEVKIGVVVLGALAGVGYLMVRSALRPLAKVKDTAEAIAAGDLTQRVPEHPPRTEIGQLSGALNGMLAQIESAFRIQQAS